MYSEFIDKKWLVASKKMKKEKFKLNFFYPILFSSSKIFALRTYLRLFLLTSFLGYF